MTPDTEQQIERLVALVRSYGRCVVAFSGGVDSAVVCKAAHLAGSESAIAVTAVSPSLASRDLADAMECARQIGITHRTLHTRETEKPAYIRNQSDRCFHCKSELYEQLQVIADEYPHATILNGTNADDLGDYRPGLEAAKQHQVRSPLAELGICKGIVRAIARAWDMMVSDKPAAPCLASRIAYGLPVTPERLQRVERAEQFLRALGFVELRVRYLEEDLARIEVPCGEVPQLENARLFERVKRELLGLGFRQVELDRRGFKSGRMNETLRPEELYRIELE